MIVGDFCHEEITDENGNAAPCKKPATGWVIDITGHGTSSEKYPVCETHWEDA